MALMLYYLSSIFMLYMGTSCGAAEDRKVHIVYMGSLPQGEYSPLSHHLGILQEVLKENAPTNALIRSYKRSFNGFAATLTNQEAQRLASMKEVVSVFPSITYQLQTTRSWDFIGFHENVKRKSSVESDIIIGAIDTGIWPESKSFGDEGFGPPPKKWKGTCKGGKNFTCNNKIVGARYYTGKSARDDEVGHGTHTASIAVGNKVKGASFYGLARGTVRGGVPSARLAVYKPCDSHGCEPEDVLAAFDDAIADGVDIITVSLGFGQPLPFDYDVIAIGAFHAMDKGILTVHSAGNGGAFAFLVTSTAPWLFSVGASRTDRRIINKVVLGNGKTVIGNSVNTFPLNGTQFPLISGQSQQCDPVCGLQCVNTTLVKGKIVLCSQTLPDLFSVRPFKAGAVGLIKPIGIGPPDTSFITPLPEADLSTSKIDLVASYIDTTTNPTVNILKSEAIRMNSSAPVAASFSLHGPNIFVLEILKPDVSAPGVEILAAYPPVISPSDYLIDKRRAHYSIKSGTSMATPHVAAIAAYVKSFHPHWSASAIKSAIMTTALPMNSRIPDAGALAYGSGHINPIKAVHPGLVYEIQTTDYVELLCALDYSEDVLRKITGRNITCCSCNSNEVAFSNNTVLLDFNYPAMTAKINSTGLFHVTFHRIVTNVGFANSTYKAKIVRQGKNGPISELKIEVTPQILSFKSVNEKKTFAVTVAGNASLITKTETTTLEWSDGAHSVRSPITVFSKLYGNGGC